MDCGSGNYDRPMSAIMTRISNANTADVVLILIDCALVIWKDTFWRKSTTSWCFDQRADLEFHSKPQIWSKHTSRFPQICSDLPNGLARCIFCARGEDASNGGSEFCDDHDHGRHENFPSSRHGTVAATLLQCSSALQELGILFVYADLACNEGWQCNDGVGGLFYSQLFLQCILL